MSPASLRNSTTVLMLVIQLAGVNGVSWSMNLHKPVTLHNYHPILKEALEKGGIQTEQSDKYGPPVRVALFFN